VHGANRLGGNGVANSTVFGAVAGDIIAARVVGERKFRDPDRAALDAAIERCERPFKARASDHTALVSLREQLYETMWEKAGIIRDAVGLAQADAELAALDAQLDAEGLPDMERAFNLTWHDWMNLKNLVAVSRVITAAALARCDSRGAHFRSDFPQTGPLEQSGFTSLRLAGGKSELVMKPVTFSRVRPGESLLKNAA
jgi:fumarate reductase flavoprotein subunit